jgi:hypothetical protein
MTALAIKRRLGAMRDRAFGALAGMPNRVGLRIVPGRAGFFGEVFCVLNGLRLAERNGLVARIAWGAASPYHDPDHATGGDAWRSFFARSTYDFRASPAAPAPRLFMRLKPHARDFDPYPGLSTRRSVGRALQAWCQPVPEIAAQADALWTRLARGRDMLGIHVRLTDAAAGAESRQTVTLGHFFAAADDWLEDRPEAGIFLATDESRVVAAFEERYGARVAYQACLRSEDGTSIHGHYDAGVPGSPYSKGREVLIDALLLARSAHLLRTHSRVTAFSLCWAPELTFRDLELEATGAARNPWLHSPSV